jgi:CheY-like chemotaxis protein
MSADVRSERRVISPFPPSLARVRALVVDDDLDASEMVCCVLEQSGAEVTILTATDSVVNVLLTQPIDLLLADLGMPGQDGYALIESVRGHNAPEVRDITAIAVTAYASEEHRSKALAAGYDAYVLKPVDAARLVRIIERLLNLKAGASRGRAQREA